MSNRLRAVQIFLDVLTQFAMANAIVLSHLLLYREKVILGLQHIQNMVRKGKTDH